MYMPVLMFMCVFGCACVYIQVIGKLWVSISSIGKVSDSCKKDPGFNLYLHQKLIGVLI